MRAYLRLDPLIDERKAHYTPAQLGAFVKVLALAMRQTDRGRFRSVETLKRSLPPNYSRQIDFLVSEGDLVVLPDGRAYVEGWDEWQEGDITVGERMYRLRNKHRNGAVTEPYRAAIGVGDGVGVGVDGSTEPSDAREDIEAFGMAQHRLPTQKQRALLDRVAEAHGGPQWAADIILRNPTDPIGAIIENDRAWRSNAEQREKADEIERNRAKRAALTPLQRQIKEAILARDAETVTA